MDLLAKTASRNLVNFMCTPQIQQAAQYVAQQRALDAGISPQDAAANGGQYGVLPQQQGQQATIADVMNSIPRQQMQPQHMMMQKMEQHNPAPRMQMMKEKYTPMQPIQRSPTVGELLGIPPGSVPGI